MQPERVVSSPVRLAGGLHLAHLTLLAATDAERHQLALDLTAGGVKL